MVEIYASGLVSHTVEESLKWYDVVNILLHLHPLQFSRHGYWARKKYNVHRVNFLSSSIKYGIFWWWSACKNIFFLILEKKIRGASTRKINKYNRAMQWLVIDTIVHPILVNGMPIDIDVPLSKSTKGQDLSGLYQPLWKQLEQGRTAWIVDI